MWPDRDMAKHGCASSGRDQVSDTLGYDKASVAEVSQSQTPLLLKLDLSPASPPGGEEYVQGPDIVLPSLLAAILHSMLAPCSSARQQSCVYGCIESTIQVLWPG